MRRLLLLPALLLPLAACSGLTAPAAAPSVPAARSVPNDELRGLLLLMVDQQRFDPFTVETALAGPPALRSELAVTLGRAGDRRAVSYLAQLVGDPEAEVRRAAAFAFGELALERTDAETAARNLLVATVDADRETGRLAVEALGKVGVAVVEVARALTVPAPLTGAELDEGERWARLLPGLFRFDEADAVPLALGGLAYSDSAADPELRRWAVFALARTPREAGLPKLRELLADPDPRVRGWAARAVGMLGDGSDLVRLLPLVAPATSGDDAEHSDAPVVQALRAAAALADKGASEPPPGWHAALLAVAADPRPQVRLELLDRVAPWLPAGDAGADSAPAAELLAWVAGRADATAAEGGEIATAERAAALLALAARRGTPGAATVTRVENAAGDDDPQIRAAAAAAAAHLPGAAAEPLLENLLADPEPQVKSAVAAAVLARLDDDASPAAAAVVASLARIPDAGVQALAYGWLADHPVVPYAELRPGALKALAAGNVETAGEVLRALGARGAAAGG
ncbi:MAG TPA: HEAT repeat domain-containing protein, partial [Thermoanaerobaculia bacterium]|nr:HEAT repeat domain-containing protein [Thermoanaerobaculia bacterium]